MNRNGSPVLSTYYVLVAVAGLALLGFNSLQPPFRTLSLEYGLIVALFVAFLANLPLRLLHSEVTLVQAVTFGVGLLYGPAPAGLVVAGGILAGTIARRLWSATRRQPPLPRRPLILDIGFSIGMQILPLTLSVGVFNLDRGTLLAQPSFVISEAIILALLFALIHSALFQAEFWLRGQPYTPSLVRDLLSLFLVESLPLPFVLLSVAAFPESQLGALVSLSAIPATLAVLMYGVSTVRTDLERRLQDLSTLNNISRTLRSTLDMNSLLAVILQQVTQLLGVDNFYVALYDLNDQQLWYPLAVKNGQRRNWPRRPLTDRLTDRVIRERRPILLAREAQQELARIGLPPSEDAPYAWLGVPLITAERTIGCLAVFSTSPEAVFTSPDLELLTTLSGQVSVAIENALLYEQAQRRAVQLENLNRTSSLITATLDLPKVLAQVCRSVSQVSGAQRSAVFLIDEQGDQITLAHAQGLSDEFRQASGPYPVTQEMRNRGLRTGRPALTAQVDGLELDDPFSRALVDEGIQAYGDFPLTTPEGQIGYLSVYFDHAHQFPSEQVELLQTFASQAALAVSNARLYARTDLALTRRARQLAILENIARELAAVIHSERLFEMILDYAVEFTDSPWGSLNLYDARRGVVEIKAARGYSPEEKQQPVSQGVTGLVIRSRQAQNIGDVRRSPHYVDMTGGKAASQLSVPMIYEDRVLGVLTLESPTPNAYTPRDQAFISQMATQAAIAVINAELYAETRRRLREQASLYQFSRGLVGNLNLERVSQIIARAIGETLDSLATGVYLWDQAVMAYRLRSFSRPKDQVEEHLPSLIDENVWDHTQPTRLDTGSLRLPLGQNDLSNRFGGCRNCQALIFPLKIGRQRLGLVLSHLPKEGLVQEGNLQLPNAIAAQGAIAIQNALLFSDVTRGHDQMEALLNSVDEGVIMLNAEGMVTLGNLSAQTLIGVPLKDIIGRKLPELPPEALRTLGFNAEQAERLIENLGQTPTTPRVTIKRSGDPMTQVLERFTAPVWGEGRRVIGWVFVVRDVSEEHRLNQARELITETLVHDLRSPVGAVSSALTILADALPSEGRDDVTYQSLDIAQRSTKRVMDLIESLLDISRMETGVFDLDLAEVDLHTLTTELLAEFTPQANELGIVLRNEIEPGTPLVLADSEKVGRVFINLLDNALKFTPEGGQVTLTSEDLGGQLVKLQVQDTGPGIPEEYRSKIFDRFSQVPSYRGRRRGSGLGLTFCLLAVEAHGGRIWVDERPGGGSAFNFTLPISGPPAYQGQD